MGKIKDYDEKLNADDSDVFIIEDATATKFTKFISLYNSIKLKLGLGTAATKDIESDLDAAVDGNPADVSICKNLKSQIDILNSEKAPTSHSSSGTEYGLASNTQYGHAKRSNTLPKVAGTANAGSENSTFAAGDHVHPLQTTVSGSSGSCTGNANTASSLQNTRYVDGVGFKGDSNIHHYGVCTTSASTATKTVSISGFSLLTGSRAIVKFTYGNTVANPTLNINSTGAKSLNYRGVGVKSGYIGANSLVEVVYDGSQYNIVGDLTQSQVDNLQGVSGLKIQYGTATITTATSTTATTVNLADSFSSNPVVTVTVDAGTYWTDRIKVSANVLSPNSFTINHISTSEGTKFPVMWIAIGK